LLEINIMAEVAIHNYDGGGSRKAKFEMEKECNGI
jgi:hypothetical protein